MGVWGHMLYTNSDISSVLLFDFICHTSLKHLVTFSSDWAYRSAVFGVTKELWGFWKSIWLTIYVISLKFCLPVGELVYVSAFFQYSIVKSSIKQSLETHSRESRKMLNWEESRRNQEELPSEEYVPSSKTFLRHLPQISDAIGI